jgi:hypothetical protein
MKNTSVRCSTAWETWFQLPNFPRPWPQIDHGRFNGRPAKVFAPVASNAGGNVNGWFSISVFAETSLTFPEMLAFIVSVAGVKSFN